LRNAVLVENVVLALTERREHGCIYDVGKASAGTNNVVASRLQLARDTYLYFLTKHLRIGIDDECAAVLTYIEDRGTPVRVGVGVGVCLVHCGGSE
jgi:hypothetical protein